MSWHNYGRFPQYITIAERKKKNAQKISKLKIKEKDLQPVIAEGRLIAKTFWGKAWCKNLESYEDYAYRLDRGRSYVRSGAVVDLKIQPGEINALVCGTRMYTVHITISTVSPEAWHSLIKECSGKINSLIELLQGKFSQHIMQIIMQPDKGLFPKKNEIVLNCSCPDYASMCKHVSAVLYGVGIRLDDSPEQLFILRQVDHTELLLSAAQDVSLGLSSPMASSIIEDDLSTLFGIEIAQETKIAEEIELVQIIKKSTKKTRKSGFNATRKRALARSRKERDD